MYRIQIQRIEKGGQKQHKLKKHNTDAGTEKHL